MKSLTRIVLIKDKFEQMKTDIFGFFTRQFPLNILLNLVGQKPNKSQTYFT